MNISWSQNVELLRTMYFVPYLIVLFEHILKESGCTRIECGDSTTFFLPRIIIDWKLIIHSATLDLGKPSQY